MRYLTNSSTSAKCEYKHPLCMSQHACPLLYPWRAGGGFWVPLECFPEVLGSFREALGALWGRFGGPWLTVEGGPLEALGGTDREPKPYCGRQFAAKSMVLWRLLGGSESTGEHLHGAQSSFWHTVAAKSMVLRGRRCFQEGPQRDFCRQL